MTAAKANPWNEAPPPGLKPAHVYARDRDWPGYFRALAHLGPRETVLKAIAAFDAEPSAARFAVDVGCGDGRDTAELLRRGWRVLALDASEEGLARLRRRHDLVHADRLEARVAAFESMDLPSCDMVVASFALPFCPPSAFPSVWARVVAAIRPGGRFAGQLFGDGDDWVSLGDRTHHTPEQAAALFAGFDLEHWQEEKRDSSVDPAAHPKRWHVYHIVARKKGVRSSQG